MHAGYECKVVTREKYVNDPTVQAWYKPNDKTAENVSRKEAPAVWLGMATTWIGILSRFYAVS